MDAPRGSISTPLTVHRSQKEIEVLLHEIFIPILEMRTSTLKQKGIILGMLSKLCQEPQALVEIYLNYDCDSEAADNIYEQFVMLLFIHRLMLKLFNLV
jgi:Sec7-like guanine-nucleotide exchange factor